MTRRWLIRLAWLALAVPGLYQVGLLAYTIARRVTYPYDLEWMEGGLLHHAQRIADGHGIYGPPSVDFIPYLYTPLYPGLLATAGTAFGIGYPLGRAISVLSLLGIAFVAAASITGSVHRAVPGPAGTGAVRAPDGRAAWVGVALALGLFAATYPWVEGWYDLVRADSFFLCLVTAGIHAAARWSRQGRGWEGHGRVAAVAAVLGLAFFAKQTGILYVAGGGLVVLVLAWRRVPAYVAVAGAIGLGGTWILQRATDGWFWIYIRDIHQAHDFNMDRFWKSFGLILWHFPALTLAVAAGLVAVAACAVLRRTVPLAARPLLLWAPVFALSTLVGAVGWGTEFAHFNAYMPAMLHGALAAGAAVPAIAACARTLAPATDRGAAWSTLPAAVVAIALGAQLVAARWEPREFIPTGADRAAGAALVRRIAAIDGEVWIPSHPWYGHLAGKRMYVHRMGVKDVTVRKPRPIAGLDAAIASHQFAALVLDNRDLHLELSSIARHYRADEGLARGEKPRLYTGARIVPDTIWVPAVKTPPPVGARVLFDFEGASFDGWQRTGGPWGTRPEPRELTAQGQVRRFGGRYFATSLHGGDAATGTLVSPAFTIDGNRITLRLGGGTDHRGLRAELRLGDDVALVAAAPSPPSETFSLVEWDVSGLRGKAAHIALVDTATGSWGHLNVDEIWIWD
jgi:hypothetical protein